ncbi:uncharacterized protein LOC133197249 [Saccostrea echinata]|uniref:uncharacterized protein LOC133197249 n=1 Tax=Saccostrea echinata TaxID=191078 RepID=UPI002A825B4C|nr:uncharacterized protein LOC133197249 [Saccostrea echinata]
MSAPMVELTPCSLRFYFEGNCGLCPKFPEENSLKYVKECNKSIAGHLRACRVAEKSVRSEGELLCLRAGIWRWKEKTDLGITVCPAHRYMYGLGWKPRLKCDFFRHPSSSKSKAQRGMSARMCELAQLRWGVLCRIGTGICRQCLDSLSEDRDDSESPNSFGVTEETKIEEDKPQDNNDHYQLRPKQVITIKDT